MPSAADSELEGQTCKMNKAELFPNSVASLPWAAETEMEAAATGLHSKQKCDPSSVSTAKLPGLGLRFN